MSRRTSPRRKNRSLFSTFNPFSRSVDRAMEFKRRSSSYGRRLQLEPLEDRRVLAVITVTSTADTVANDGVTTLREAIIAANTNADPSGDTTAGRAAAWKT